MRTDTQWLASAAFDANALNALKTRLRQQPGSRAAQLAVARQVEGLFIAMMLNSMRQALPKDGLLTSEQSQLYTRLYDQQIAQHISARGSGLAQLILQQMSPAAPPAPVDGQSLTRDKNQALNQLLARALPHPAAADPLAHSALARDNQQFLQQLAHPAKLVSEQSGIPHRLILAQAALESGWGQRQIRTASGAPSFNLFGIKASSGWKGPVAQATTTEYENGVAKKVSANFRVYHSYLESLTDYIRLLTNNPRYAKVLSAATPEQGARALQNAGYASDPAYAQKLNSIIGQIKALSDKARRVSQLYNSQDLLNLF